MTLADTITVIILLAGGTFIAGMIIHLIYEEIEYRRWWRKMEDEEASNQKRQTPSS